MGFCERGCKGMRGSKTRIVCMYAAMTRDL